MKSSNPAASLFEAVALVRRFAHAGTLILALFGFSGCATNNNAPVGSSDVRSDIILREGDVLRVSFPTAPTLAIQSQPIRRDGKITLPIVGEVTAAGLTPAELQRNLTTLFASQLQSKDVLVTVVSSAFEVFVDGYVLRPGKVTADHPLTIIEAIIDAGGFDYAKANLKSVTILRQQPTSKRYTYFRLNLKDVIEGRKKDVFYLAPGDIVHVPEKFSFF